MGAGPYVCINLADAAMADTVRLVEAQDEQQAVS